MLLLDAQGKVDETIETVETVTDITEDLGEDVEKVAEALENKIPDQEAKLKEAVETIDRLAKDVVKETEEAKRLIQKVPPIRSLSLSLFRGFFSSIAKFLATTTSLSLANQCELPKCQVPRSCKSKYLFLCSFLNLWFLFFQMC